MTYPIPSAAPTPTQLAILAHLQQRGPCSNSELAKAFGMGGRTVGVHTHHLKAAGLVQCVGWGFRARWHAAPQHDPISRCPSVWAYAERLAQVQEVRA